MSLHHRAPVVVPLTELSDTTIESLALQIAEQQKKEVGTTYGYCAEPGCGMPLKANTVRLAKKAGRIPNCWAHRKTGVRSKDNTIYLCSVCRIVLSGDRLVYARRLYKKGIVATCGNSQCKKTGVSIRVEASKKPKIPCCVCGEPISKKSSTQVRAGICKPYCMSRSCKAEAQRRVSLVLQKNMIDPPRGIKKDGASSKYIGVRRHAKAWETSVRYKGLTIHVGRFATELEAAQAYDIAACDILGKNAKLNFGIPGYV